MWPNHRFFAVFLYFYLQTSHSLRIGFRQRGRSESPLSAALKHLVDPHWQHNAVQGEGCPRHVFVSLPNVSSLAPGAADRLRGVYIGALAAALSGRQLHVDPWLLGPLHAEPDGALHELKRNVSRLQSSGACSGNTRLEHLDATFHDPWLCANSPLLQRTVESDAAIVVASSNCFVLPVPSHSGSHVVPVSHTALDGLLRCAGHVPALYLNSSGFAGGATTMNQDDMMHALRDARRVCPTAVAAARGSPFPHWMEAGPPLRQASIPPHHAASCGALPRSVACSTVILRHVWALRSPRTAAVLAAAEAAQLAWSRALAPAGYTVLHLRAARTEMQLAPQCVLPSVPWADPVPPSWAAGAVGRAWMQQLQQLSPLEAAASAGGRRLPAVVVLSDSARLQRAVSQQLVGSVELLSCCSQPVHSGRAKEVGGGGPPSAHEVVAARQVVFDLITIARANVLIHGRGMFWSAGVFWLGWEQGPVLVEAWAPSQVPRATTKLLQPWPQG